MHRETVFAAAVVILSVFVQSEAFPGFVNSLQGLNKGSKILSGQVEVRNNNPEVIIKNKKSGLVLDGSGNYVEAQQFDGSQTQIWRKEPYNGKWAFINKANGHFLDIEGGQASSGAYLVTMQHSGHPSQQWLINPDGTIVSSANGNLAIDIAEPGSRVIVSEVQAGDDNQIFDLVIQ